MTIGKILFYCALLAGAVYCALTLHPAVLFSNNYVYKNMTLYTHDSLKEPPDKLLSTVYEQISAGDFYDADRNLEIYLAGGSVEYSLLALTGAGKFACANPVSDKVFVASADIDKNLAYPPGGDRIGRDLAGVISHEVVKIQLKNKFGPLNYFLMPDWKKEGYAEHLARETQDMNPTDFCHENTLSDPALPFLENKLIVELVTLEDRIGYLVLMTENYSYDSVKARVEQHYCGRKL